ncbi:hypothetical protein HELRODRAFT_102735 [Helobdella robusta]|uniref:DNA primase n=1 Tax=Helobdella robusta TaxID=6412 RepID=T1EDB3_HELRO|nr:hypothetical protein HELRODRAFT_102735 [Helobdella robusta]ESN95157.1 hypothetical protein HELRODRAFT_102735 [Helobdella robusta]
MAEYNQGMLPDLLPVYYKKIFPHNFFYRWLSYGGEPKSYYTNREFSFTLMDDVYIRYLSFSDGLEFEKELIKTSPFKIDIGAVFSHRPKDQKTLKPGSFQAMEKELVFDIDMTDYDDVRSCCSGADICHNCWPLMAVGVQIIDRALREDFGFEHRLWARALPSNARSAIVDYLTLVKGGENQVKKVNLSSLSLHPHIQESLSILNDRFFEDYAICKQNFLNDDSKMLKMMKMLPDDLQTMIKKFLDQQDPSKLNSKNRWEALKIHADKKRSQLIDLSNEKKPPKDIREQLRKHSHLVEEIKLQYCYPRLDANVTKGVNHLLKSPFCIHPKTGRVCVPFCAEEVWQFNPFTVPTITQLCNELDNLDVTDAKKKKDFPLCKSLNDAVEVFKKFVEDLEKSFLKKRKEQNDMTLQF